MGSAEMATSNAFKQGTLELTVGEYDYYRLLSTDSFSSAGGEWLYGLELNYNDGPWTDIEEDMKKYNFLLKHSNELAGGQLELALMAYDKQWKSADQIPKRAVDSGLIDDFGSLDDSVGGESSRYSLSLSWQGEALNLSAYVIKDDMNIWSNFTYFLDDEVNGDQFGTEIRADVINEVGLYQSQNRQRLGVVRSDKVDEFSC